MTAEQMATSDILLMRLSGEIRNAIYELIIAADRSIANPDEICLAWYEQDSRRLTCDRPRTVLPAITQMSQQIRHESLGIYYGTKTFAAYWEWKRAVKTHEDGNFGTVEIELFRIWLTAIGADNAARVKRIVLRFASVEDSKKSHQQLDTMAQYFKQRLLTIEPSLDQDCVFVEFSNPDMWRHWLQLKRPKKLTQGEPDDPDVLKESLHQTSIQK